MKDPPDKQYQTYAMQSKAPAPDYSKTYGRLDDEDDDYNAGSHRVTFQETSLYQSTNGPSNNVNPYSWGDEQAAGTDQSGNQYNAGAGATSNPFKTQ